MNLGFQAMIVLALLLQKGMSEQIDITDLLQKLEFFMNDSGELEVYNPEDFQLDIEKLLEQAGQETKPLFDENQIELFDNQNY